MELNIMQGLVRRVITPAPDIGLDVLPLAERGLCDPLTLIEMRQV